jgi:predicted membrane protein
MKRLSLATLLLFINGVMLLYYAYAWNSIVYLLFAFLSLILAYGVRRENRTAIKVALIYVGINFFLALLFLIAGNLFSAVDAAISFFVIHDILGYIQEVYREEESEGAEGREGELEIDASNGV